MRASVHLPTTVDAAELTIEAPASGVAKVIGITAGSLSTTAMAHDPSDPSFDIARIAVLERHRGTGRIGLGYVSGFGLQRGAIGSTVAHDAHNVMLVGGRGADGPPDMAVAAARLNEIGGGQVVVLNGEVLGEVRLPIGGLMSDLPTAEVAGQLTHLVELAGRNLGVTIAAPFMQLSFLGLSVIPELRLTDKGLVDVVKFELTSLDATT
jgi:adenine deaminase